MNIGVFGPHESISQENTSIIAETYLEVIALVNEEKDFYGRYYSSMLKNVMIGAARKLNQEGYNFRAVDIGNPDVGEVYPVDSEDTSEGDTLTTDKLKELRNMESVNEAGYSSDG